MRPSSTNPTLPLRHEVFRASGCGSPDSQSSWLSPASWSARPGSPWRKTPLSGSVVAALFTSVVTSLPELVTVLTAIRIGALTLAVSNIVGGNSFDVLFVFVADIAFTSGSVYNAVDGAAVFLLSLTVLLTALLAAGMLTRERRHIGFEGLAILGCYFAGVVALVSM